MLIGSIKKKKKLNLYHVPSLDLDGYKYYETKPAGKSRAKDEMFVISPKGTIHKFGYDGTDRIRRKYELGSPILKSRYEIKIFKRKKRKK